jgi:citrate lyase beta subunit
MLVFAARAAGVDPIDTVFPRVTDDAGLRKETEFIKQLGFEGKSVIHPNQIPIIHDVFNPTEKEIEKALKIVAAAKDRTWDAGFLTWRPRESRTAVPEIVVCRASAQFWRSRAVAMTA